MNVLSSLGLHNLVDIIQSKLSQPPSFTASHQTPAPSSMYGSAYNSNRLPPSSVSPQHPPSIPPRPRQPTEHDSLASFPTSMNFNTENNLSMPASTISLKGFSLDGKTGT